MFAVIKSGGRQYKVAVGEQIQVNRLLIDRQMVEVGSQVRFEEVLLISDAGNTMVGTPVVDGALVLATATEQGRGEKLIVFKYKSKKRYRHKRGHRQELTFLTIDDIVANGKSLVTGEAPTFRENASSEEEAEETATPAESGVATPSDAGETASQDEPEKKSRRRRATKADEGEAQASDSTEE